MSNDKPPTGQAHDGDRLPVPSGRQGELPLAVSPQTLALDLYADEQRGHDDEIDLLAYWRVLVKRRWLILAVLAGVLATSLLVTLLTPSIYRATATLQIDRETLEVLQVEGMSSVEGGAGADFYQTQYELLKSRALAERVADELNVETDIDRISAPSWFGRVKGMLRSETPPPEATSSKAEQMSRVVALIQQGLDIEPVGSSRLVRIHYESRAPAFAARVANAIADGFITASIERRFGASSYARNYLEDQLKEMKGRLEQSERELVAFAQKENIVSTGTGQSLAGQNLSDLNSALADAQAKRIAAQARWDQAQSTDGAALPAGMLANSLLPTLQQQRATLQGEYQQKLQVYKPAYPEMLQLQGQIDEVNRQIDTELANIRASIKAEYDMAQAQETLLVAQLSSLRNQSLDVDNRSIRYTILKREVDTNRQLYDGLLQRYKEIGIAGGVGSNNISIIDRAQAPGSRYKPSLPFNLMLGLLLGMVLGVLLALLLEFLDDTLKTPEDVEQRLRLPVMGIIPKLAARQTPEEASADPRSAFSEAYRSVRTALQFSTEQGIPRVLLITSPVPSEGKSTTALSLARNFTQLGKRVLLIEADLRNPSLSKALGVRAETGLSSVLAGVCSPNEAIYGSDDPRLEIIPAGPLPPNPAELLSGSRLVSLLVIAVEKYDQVVIDGPPVLGIADTPILANAAKATLLVLQSSKSRITTTQIAIKRLAGARARLIGALLTQYDPKLAGYGHDYDAYYTYGVTPRLGKV